ncbi:probable proteasome inhibitor isoform X2 [Phoenix dactylifera]|uniref:Probable proteasome inhibitor isoform X2 n=1 Tax=Phoenix dactylifera TaxID=42345 RepID=A0A8B9A552_PHODC|nr:probable proteasome inhibitor isoform X2 [Phoenix dactylifera]
MATESAVMAVIRASRPSFRNPHDKVAFAVHASFLAAGFSLTATGKNALSDNPPIGGEEVGIEGWNELEDSYGFLYSKTEKGQKKNVLVRCLVIGDILAIDGLNLEGEQKEPFNLQIKVNDYLYDDGNMTSNYGELYKDLKGLIKNLNSGILAKLEPKVGSSGEGLHKSTAEPAIRIPVDHQPQNSGIVYPPVPPFEFNDALPGPGSGFYPERSSGVGGDMLVGPNDPRWFGSGEFPGSLGGLPSVPPGARFDPYGPPGVPGFEPSRFARRPRQPGSGAHPDVQFFPRDPDYI